MKTTIAFSNKVLIVTLLIFYIYAVNFNYIPLSGKMILGVMGILFISGISFPKPIWNYIFYPIFLVLWGGIITILTGFFQFQYNVLLGFINAVLASCFIYKACKLDKCSLSEIFHFIVIAIFVESIISLLIKLSPSFYNLISIFVDFHLEEVTSLEDYYRFVGLGSASFFGVMPSCALGLFSCVYLLLDETDKMRKLFYYIAIFVISIVSILTARFCFVLVLLAFLYYIKCKGVRHIFITSTLLIFGFYAFFTYLLPMVVSDAMADWFYDAFENDSGSMMESGSGQSWMGMLERSKMELFTFLFGDGAYTAADGIHYYKRIDIGYIRQLLYYGIVGLVVNLIYQYRLGKFSTNIIKEKKFSYFIYGMYLSYLIMLVKGDISIADYFILIAVICYYKKNKFFKIKLYDS